MTQERLRKSDHLNPLRDVPHLEQVAAAALSIARIRYYTPLVGGFVENIMMRVAERALARRAARKLAASTPGVGGVGREPNGRPSARGTPQRQGADRTRRAGVCGCGE